jgi:hypothetical protein
MTITKGYTGMLTASRVAILEALERAGGTITGPVTKKLFKLTGGKSPSANMHSTLLGMETLGWVSLGKVVIATNGKSAITELSLIKMPEGAAKRIAAVRTERRIVWPKPIGSTDAVPAPPPVQRPQAELHVTLTPVEQAAMVAETADNAARGRVLIEGWGNRISDLESEVAMLRDEAKRDGEALASAAQEIKRLSVVNEALMDALAKR